MEANLRKLSRRRSGSPDSDDEHEAKKRKGPSLLEAELAAYTRGRAAKGKGRDNEDDVLAALGMFTKKLSRAPKGKEPAFKGDSADAPDGDADEQAGDGVDVDDDLGWMGHRLVEVRAERDAETTRRAENDYEVRSFPPLPLRAGRREPDPSCHPSQPRRSSTRARTRGAGTSSLAEAAAAPIAARQAGTRTTGEEASAGGTGEGAVARGRRTMSAGAGGAGVATAAEAAAAVAAHGEGGTEDERAKACRDLMDARRDKAQRGRENVSSRVECPPRA